MLFFIAVPVVILSLLDSIILKKLVKKTSPIPVTYWKIFLISCLLKLLDVYLIIVCLKINSNNKLSFFAIVLILLINLCIFHLFYSKIYKTNFTKNLKFFGASLLVIIIIGLPLELRFARDIYVKIKYPNPIASEESFGAYSNLCGRKGILWPIWPIWSLCGPKPICIYYDGNLDQQGCSVNYELVNNYLKTQSRPLPL